MTKRYYISNKVGTGTEDDPIRSKILDYGIGSSSIMGNRAWCIGIVNITNEIEDSDIIFFPYMDPETLVFSLEEETRVSLFNRISDFTGLTLPEVLPTTTFWRVIEYLGQTQVLDFTYHKLGVADG